MNIELYESMLLDESALFEDSLSDLYDLYEDIDQSQGQASTGIGPNWLGFLNNGIDKTIGGIKKATGNAVKHVGYKAGTKFYKSKTGQKLLKHQAKRGHVKQDYEFAKNSVKDQLDAEQRAKRNADRKEARNKEFEKRHGRKPTPEEEQMMAYGATMDEIDDRISNNQARQTASSNKTDSTDKQPQKASTQNKQSDDQQPNSAAQQKEQPQPSKTISI